HRRPRARLAERINAAGEDPVAVDVPQTLANAAVAIGVGGDADVRYTGGRTAARNRLVERLKVLSVGLLERVEIVGAGVAVPAAARGVQVQGVERRPCAARLAGVPDAVVAA